MFTILVAGAGYVGSEIAGRFAFEKQKVFAVTRTPKRREEWIRKGIFPICADLTKPDSLRGVIPPAHFIVYCPAPDRHDAESYEALYLAGISHLLDLLKEGPKPRLFVYLSSTKVWGRQIDGWVDESTPASPDGRIGEILAEAEKRVLNSGVPAVILRMAEVYGPGRNRIESVKNGAWPVAGPDRYMNMIHRDDLAGAMKIIFNRAKPGEIYVASDSEPVPVSAVYRWLSEKLGMPSRSNLFTAEPVSGKRCRNTKIKDIGVILRYPSFRVGYEEFVRGHVPNMSPECIL